MLGGFLEARTGATLGLAPPLPNRDWDSKDGQTVTMTFSERPAPAVVTTPATETLPVAPPGTARTLCTNEPSPEGQSFSPGDGSGGGGGGLRGLSERWPVPFAVSVLLALASFGFGVAWVVVWYVRLVKAAFDAQAGLH